MKKILTTLTLVPALALSAFAGVIQDKINAAQAGDVVVIPAGTYNENITIKDGVMLFSEAGPESTIIESPNVPFAVVFGRDSALVGFTVRGGQQSLYNMGNFFGVFECNIEGFSQIGINIEKGSAAILYNRVSGSNTTTGINCTEANPYIGYNLIENNHTGFNVTRFLVPTLDHNIFRNNQIAVNSGDGTEIQMLSNIFFGNGQNSVGVKLGIKDEVREPTAEELKLQRGIKAADYRALMKKIFEEAAAGSPRIMYDLSSEAGVFNLIVTYPYATFSVSASTRDTVIKNYDAYDRDTDGALNAQYAVAQGHPTVAVLNPQITDKAFDRFVLEKRFEHPASYSFGNDGKRTFNRLTNLPRIEVILPPGFTATETNPGSTTEQRGNRQVVKLLSMGMTTLNIVMAPAAPAAP